MPEFIPRHTGPVTAEQFNGQGSLAKIMKWLNTDDCIARLVGDRVDYEIIAKNEHGAMEARLCVALGDYVVKSRDGKWMVMDHDVFTATYRQPLIGLVEGLMTADTVTGGGTFAHTIASRPEGAR